MEHTPEEIWTEILSGLSEVARKDVYLRQAKPLALDDTHLTIAVPAGITQDQIEMRFLDDINHLLQKQPGAIRTLRITVAQPDARQNAASEPTNEPILDSVSASKDTPARPSTGARLNTRSLSAQITV